MDLTDLEHKLNGTSPIPKCNNLYTLLGAYKCPKCFNESKGSTMDGSYWDWEEVHCCENCETKYWFSNGAY